LIERERRTAVDPLKRLFDVVLTKAKMTLGFLTILSDRRHEPEEQLLVEPFNPVVRAVERGTWPFRRDQSLDRFSGLVVGVSNPVGENRAPVRLL